MSTSISTNNNNNYAAEQRPVILPSKGSARVKNVLSGDSVVLLGKAAGPNLPQPEVTFTLESLSAPRYVREYILL
jgi:hypothetical protein